MAQENPRSSYASVPWERARAQAANGVTALVADITEESRSHFGEALAKVAEQRVRQGFRIFDMHHVIDVAEHVMRDFYHQEYTDLAERLAAIERIHDVLVRARNMLAEAYLHATETVVSEQTVIVKQLSAPLIPITKVSSCCL
jgi:hypothetical protein